MSESTMWGHYLGCSVPRETSTATTTTIITMVATTQCLHSQQVLGQRHRHYSTSEQLPQFGEAVLTDTRYLVNYRRRQKNLDQKIRNLDWQGSYYCWALDCTTTRWPVCDNHPSVTGSIYKCRGVTRLPRPNMWDTTFLATSQWPPMESMDYSLPDVSENYKCLQEHNTSTREQLAQQPEFQPVQEQPQQRAQRRETAQPQQLPVPPQEPLGTGHYYKSCSDTTIAWSRTSSCTTTWTAWYYYKSTASKSSTYCTTTTTSTTTTCCWTTTTSTCWQPLYKTCLKQF